MSSIFDQIAAQTHSTVIQTSHSTLGNTLGQIIQVAKGFHLPTKVENGDFIMIVKPHMALVNIYVMLSLIVHRQSQWWLHLGIGQPVSVICLTATLTSVIIY